ncbi:MAG: hypothetical protein NVSMB6_11960 [Burkholderiaceae bacterium]
MEDSGNHNPFSLTQVRSGQFSLASRLEYTLGRLSAPDITLIQSPRTSDAPFLRENRAGRDFLENNRAHAA